MGKIELLRKRHSVRSFKDRPIPDDILKKLKAEITMTNTHEQGIKFQLITDDPEPFRGFSKSYGLFRNPDNYMAGVVDTATPNILERAGYFAEKFVMKAVELGLGTCFIGGTYDASKVKAQLRAGEKILFLVAVGYESEESRPLARMMEKFVHRKKPDISDFFIPASDLDKACNQWEKLKDGLTAVAYAPSSLNRRPVRIFLKEKDAGVVPCAETDVSNPKNLIDLGIAKFNFNYATDTECEWGNGSPLAIQD